MVTDEDEDDLEEEPDGADHVEEVCAAEGEVLVLEELHVVEDDLVGEEEDGAKVEELEDLEGEEGVDDLS